VFPQAHGGNWPQCFDGDIPKRCLSRRLQEIGKKVEEIKAELELSRCRGRHERTV